MSCHQTKQHCHLISLIYAVLKEPAGERKQPNNYGSHSLIHSFIQQTHVKYHMPDTVPSSKKKKD